MKINYKMKEELRGIPWDLFYEKLNEHGDGEKGFGFTFKKDEMWFVLYGPHGFNAADLRVQKELCKAILGKELPFVKDPSDPFRFILKKEDIVYPTLNDLQQYGFEESYEGLICKRFNNDVSALPFYVGILRSVFIQLNPSLNESKV